MADVVEERGRLGLKAAIEGTADDDDRTFDIREDEEQNVKLQETIDLLVAAGYFRARIKGLAAFDKVVGGLVWCISMCTLDVDVDLFYQENSTIGQKIALTEKLVQLLPQMRCPHAIEPHQIQGLDFIHIFPVVQWLVKMAIEAKEEMGDLTRSVAVAQFDRYHSQPIDVKRKAVDKSRAAQRQIRGGEEPERLLRRVGQVEEQSKRVQCTLLEYGWQRSGAGAGGSSAGGAESSAVGTSVESSSRAGQTTSRQAVDDEVSELLGGMQQVKSSEVSAAAIASLIDRAHIERAATQFARSQPVVAAAAAAAAATSARPVAKPRLLPKPRASATNDWTSTGDPKARADVLKRQIEQLRLESDRLDSQITQKNAAHAELLASDAQVDSELVKIAQLEAQVEHQTAERLKDLMAQHDEIKKRESGYKERCKAELARLDEEIERRRSAANEPEATLQSDTREVSEKLSSAKEALQRRRLELAERNRQVAALQRKIDQVPSQAELNQYQRRFIELYNQVASKHRETKQFFTLHNTLLDVKAYLKREIDLLDNIYDVQALATQAGYKQSFVDNLEGILQGVRQNKVKVERKEGETRRERDNLRDNYQEMLDKQRLYFKTVKEFQEECKRNEQLNARLAQIQSDK